MNILFATLVDINDIEERGIYQDLIRELAGRGHDICVVSPAERRYGKKTSLSLSGAVSILKVRVGNIQKTNPIEKGIATVLLEFQYLRAVRKLLPGTRFDLIIYSTPPITLFKLIRYIKKRDGAACYLLLKDIFPQNAADLGLFSSGGIIHRYFKKKEKKLYAISDHIGCMSPANAGYVLAHNPQISPTKVHVCPNCITPLPKKGDENRSGIREKYGIPPGCTVFMYGGNLGKPQCVPFIIQCLKQNQDKDDRYFLVCGDGTDANMLMTYLSTDNPHNVRLIATLPKDEYDELLPACDIGLIFLDHRFTIPNFPSRLLSYMEQGLPVLACTDSSTDVGETVTAGGFGWWCGSGDPAGFTDLVDEICMRNADDLRDIGARGRRYLEENFLASQAAGIILDRVGSR